MTALYIILGILAYLAIGGFLNGLFDTMGIDDSYWYLMWPFVILMIVINIIVAPFENLGYWVLTKIRVAKNKKKK